MVNIVVDGEMGGGGEGDLKPYSRATLMKLKQGMVVGIFRLY